MTSPAAAAPVDLHALFDAAGVDARLHVVDLATGAAVEHGADDTVLPASVFKVPVLLELFRQDAASELDVREHLTLPPTPRTAGGTGVSAMLDEVTLSLRDLALLMVTVSDNAATDALCARVGLDRVQACVDRLGLVGTVIGGDCQAVFDAMVLDGGAASLAELLAQPLGDLPALDPARSPFRTTPRDMTRLLGLVWADEAAPAAACAEVRRILGLQVWPHRLASGFTEPGWRVAGKTGTLPGVRNEVGVVEHPDGVRYAVACFTTARDRRDRHPAADAVIGASARAAVDALRR